MEKLNKLVEIADDAISSDVYELRVKVGDILAIEEAFRAMEQRAEAAEAKLAELEKQKPYGYVAESPCSSGYGGMMHEFSIDRHDAEHDANQAEGFVVELFTRPAPAINLAELVPDVDEESPFKVISISWLKCKCGNTKIDVTTINGNAHRLCEDDDAMCNSCGRKGIIQCNEGYAGVLWETDEEYAESKRAAILRKIESLKPLSPGSSSSHIGFDPAGGKEETVITHHVAPPGWKLVPIEPTKKQWAAGVKAMDAGIDKPTLCYSAMLAAAPEVE